MKYIYGMRLRGFSIGCQPMDGLIERQDDTTGRYYDLLVYGRKLTENELLEYELDRIEEIEGGESLNEKELLNYEEQCGTESAINILLLTPPDRFEGDYDAVMEQLEKRRREQWQKHATDQGR